MQFIVPNLSLADSIIQQYQFTTLVGIFEPNESIWHEEVKDSLKEECDKLQRQRANGIAAWWIIVYEEKIVDICRLKDVGKLIMAVDKFTLCGAWLYYKFFIPMPVGIISEFLEHIYSHVISIYGIETLIIEPSRIDLK